MSLQGRLESASLALDSEVSAWRQGMAVRELDS